MIVDEDLKGFRRMRPWYESERGNASRVVSARLAAVAMIYCLGTRQYDLGLGRGGLRIGLCLLRTVRLKKLVCISSIR
jgi:hypothetical protein